MKTLGRATFVECLERDYDIYFDGTHTLVYLHVDNLKHYNHLNGVEAGDAILHSVIDWVAGKAAGNLVARYAGDGLAFVVTAGDMDSMVADINALLPNFGEVNGLRAKLGTIVCTRPMDVEDAMGRALYACSSIDRADGVYLCEFGGDVKQRYDKRLYITGHLDDAIARGEIQAWAQPIVRVLTGKICEVEILARWQSERYGFLFPDEFIPALEQYQLIHKLDLEVIRLACSLWSQTHELGTNVPIGINLSRLDFELCDIYSRIREIMSCYDVPVDQFHIEVTESIAVHDEVITEGVRRFRDAGFQVYMDDFGSGYSSLGQMAELRFDVIKFDKGMIDEVANNERARVVLADSISMVKRLGLQTLCEGVETAEQLEFLRAVGCEKAQGYFFGRPANREAIMEELNSRACRPEEQLLSKYLDAIGQVNLLEGTSAGIHGVEAAAFLGRSPVAVMELADSHLRMLTCNFAFKELVNRMGYASFGQMTNTSSKTGDRINARALNAARVARDTAEPQVFDFIAGGVFCSATVEFVARMEGREAYICAITSVEKSPQVTEHTLLTGVLETSNLCFFWKDTERRFIGANQRFFDYYGFGGLEDIIGKTDEEMAWHTDDEPFHDDEVQVLQGHKIYDARGVCLCKGQLRDIIATKRPLYSHGEIVGLVGYFEDVGPHKGEVGA